MESVLAYPTKELEKEPVLSTCVRDVNFPKGLACKGTIFHPTNFDLAELWFHWKDSYGK